MKIEASARTETDSAQEHSFNYFSLSNSTTPTKYQLPIVGPTCPACASPTSASATPTTRSFATAPRPCTTRCSTAAPRNSTLPAGQMIKQRTLMFKQTTGEHLDKKYQRCIFQPSLLSKSGEKEHARSHAMSDWTTQAAAWWLCQWTMKNETDISWCVWWLPASKCRF